MTESVRTTDYPNLRSGTEVDDYVRMVSDTIHDPCAMAAGLKLGINEMGLIRSIQAAVNNEGTWRVDVTLRLTSPGCEYFFAFRDNLQQKLYAHPQIAQVEVEWDPTLDWTPGDLTESARKRLEQRRGELWRSAPAAQSADNKQVLRLEVT